MRPGKIGIGDQELRARQVVAEQLAGPLAGFYKIWPERLARLGQTSPVTVKLAIHEEKARLPSVLAELAKTGEEVEITKHGRVVARLVLPNPTGVKLGIGAPSTGGVPTLEELRWSDDEIDSMLGAPTAPP